MDHKRKALSPLMRGSWTWLPMDLGRRARQRLPASIYPGGDRM